MFQDFDPLMKEEPKVDVAPSRTEVRLDLGCGQHPRDGFEGVDLYSTQAKHKIDLFKFPFPWVDNSVDELHSSHFLEHLPAREVEERDLDRSNRMMREELVDATTGRIISARNFDRIDPERFIGQDFLFAFMDECWRVIKPGGTMLVIVPNARSDRGFQDPTHRRFFVPTTFAYFSKDWRVSQGLDHYRVRCDWGSSIVPIILKEYELLHPQAQQRRFNHEWNTVLDWHATLTAKK